MIEPLLLPTHAGKPIHWHQLPGNASALAVATAALAHDGPVVVITADQYQAHSFRHACEFFLPSDSHLTIMTLPDWEILPYDHFSPHQDIISERLQTLATFPTLAKGLLFVPISTALQLLTPREHICHCLNLRVGQRLVVNAFRNQLTQAGYYAVSQVTSHGEFAVRGELIDLFVMGTEQPIRIDLFDEEIESIRTFDADDQRTIDKIDSFTLLPAYEFPLTEEGISHFRQQWRKTFTHDPLASPIYQRISKGQVIGGIEYYLPLFFENTETLFDYLPKQSCVILMEGVREQVPRFLSEVRARYDQHCGNITRPILAPEAIYFREEAFFSAVNQHKQIQCHQTTTTQKPQTDFHCQPLPDLSVNPHALENRFQQLKDLLNKTKIPSLLCADTAGRAEQLQQMLRREGIVSTTVKNWQQFITERPSLAITQGRLSQGFTHHSPPMLIISDNDLFGEPVYQSRRRSNKTIDPEFLFKNLAELELDSPVVHRDHGVGRYKGLTTMTVSEHKQEFLVIEYADADKLYVPIANLDCISRYSGVDIENAPIHGLGGPEWGKLMKKAAKRAHDAAAELLQLYALRATRQGYTFTVDANQYTSFSNEFPFEETLDQTKAIISIVEDMQSSKPMDRLICGDVGFGKTEVAMRAAFIAAMNNKQVAILVPTTLLAQQHYQTFCDRFSQWPLQIGVLSRLSTAKEQKRTLEQIQAGKVDIVIGTHKLLQSDIKFPQLQLVIIDEEHRFGVRQKERLKSLRAEVDILSLTATPIPRTMNMAMAGVRDLSIISTPPAKRLAIRTFVHEYDKNLIKEAIQREMLRGGQVFFLHNNVDTIDATVARLQGLLPDAKIACAHGQMRERDLEGIMTAFYHHQYNILVCTTIIETGIDIPTANTIIIERADRFGLAQLHQLRGRVGRSHHQAYAYLITPPYKSMTRDAQQRLDAIAKFDDLNVGFSLATLDLEIRGAGDFLGEDQSGHIAEIGFSFYQELLERAITSLKEGKLPGSAPSQSSVDLNLPIATLIPEDFIPDVHTRLVLYKRIADTKNQDQLSDLQSEIVDRFGKIPQPLINLLALTGLKLQCQALGIDKINVGQQYGRIDFTEQTTIQPQTIIKLIQTQASQYQLVNQRSLRFTLQNKGKPAVIDEINRVLTTLAQ